LDKNWLKNSGRKIFYQSGRNPGRNLFLSGLFKPVLAETCQPCCTRGAHQNLEVPLQFYAMAETSEFKIGTQLWFVKVHHKIPHRKIRARSPGLRELPKILGFPFNTYATAEASGFKAGMQLGFPKAHHTQRKSERDLVLGKLPKIWRSHLIFLDCPRSVSTAFCYNSCTNGNRNEILQNHM